MLLEDRLPESPRIALHATNLNPEEYEAMQEGRPLEIVRLTLVEREVADSLPRDNFVESKSIELLIEIADDRQAPDAIGHPSEPGADIDFINRFEKMRRFSPRITFTAAGNESVDDVVQERPAAPAQSREHH